MEEQMNKPPAFQFYADDFVAGTSVLSTEEIGAYILLLCHQWNAGSIPNDDNLIRRIAKVTQAFDLGLLKTKFELIDGVLKNPRMEREREKQRLFREKQAENGAKGGRPKSQAFPKPNPTDNPHKSFPSPSPSPNDTRKGKATFEQVKAFCEEAGLPQSDAEWFFYKCEGNGWTNKGEPIKDWKATIRSWKAGSYMPSQKQSQFSRPATPPAPKPADKVKIGSKWFSEAEPPTREKLGNDYEIYMESFNKWKATL